jgi:hypothetical protein
MDEDQMAEWAERIDTAFMGEGGIVGGDHLMDLTKHEEAMSKHLMRQFRGYLRLMDAFFDFYVETLRETSRREETKWPDKIIVFTLTHVATLWRFRASYSCFWKGYYEDARSLLRAVLENAFLIAALQRQIIEIKELFGDGASLQRSNISEEKIYKLIRKRISECDKKVRSTMIGHSSGLNSEAQQDLDLFVQGLHMAVHKSQTNFLWGFKKWFYKEPLTFFPPWDESLANLYLNSSSFLGWMILRTLPLLQLEDGEFSDHWMTRYQVLNESFKDMVASFPDRLGRSVEEFLQKKFDFADYSDANPKR